MDDLKLFARNDDELEGLFQIVKSFSDDSGMSYGLDKCAKALNEAFLWIQKILT